MLFKAQAQMDEDISIAFKKFDTHFENQKEEVEVQMKLSQNWMTKVCSKLDNYTNEIDRNPEHIAYEILDNDPLNENSVMAISNEAEEWIDAATEKRKF